MVVFTCNHCGESLHKPKVEKHYQFQCKNYKSITCVDCFKDFKGDEYVAHTKCITEDERYAAKGTYQNGIVKKGEVKQENWLEMIKSICDNEKSLKPSIRKMLETISGYTNVPRKKAKFMNFIKSSSGNRANMQEVEEVWNIIEKHKAEKAPNTPNMTNKVADPLENERKQDNKRSIENGDDSVKKKKKRANDDNSTAYINGATEDDTVSQKFDYISNIMEIVSKKQSISLKKLQKKIVKAYILEKNQTDCEEKVIKKINKKLKKIPGICVEDNRVSLAV